MRFGSGTDFEAVETLVVFSFVLAFEGAGFSTCDVSVFNTFMLLAWGFTTFVFAAVAFFGHVMRSSNSSKCLCVVS